MARLYQYIAMPERRFGRTQRAGHDAAMHVCMFEAQAPTLHQQMHAPTFTGLAAGSLPTSREMVGARQALSRVRMRSYRRRVTGLQQ